METNIVETEGQPHPGSRRPLAGCLVEREAELAGIKQALAAARRGAGNVTLIESPQGMGKSRLLAAAADAARVDGMRVLSAAGRELERDFAFGVAVQLLEPEWKAADPTGYARLFSSLAVSAPRPVGDGPDEAGTRPSGDWFAVIHGLFDLMRSLSDTKSDGATRTPTALFIDDVNRADAASLRFLAYLGARIAPLRIAVLAAARAGEGATDKPALAALRRAAGNTVLRPERLSLEGVATLVAAAFPGARRPFVEACERLTNGNPFLVVAMLDELVRIAPETDPPPPSPGAALAPDIVLSVVRSQLTTVMAEASAVAHAVAALGDDVPLSVVAAVTGLDVEVAARCADSLAAIHLLHPGAPLSYSHPLISSAVRASIPALERARLQQRAAERRRADPAGGPERPALSVGRDVPPANPVTRTSVVPRASVTPRSPDPAAGTQADDADPSQRLVELARTTWQQCLRGAERARVRELGDLAWQDAGLMSAAGIDAATAALVPSALLVADELERAIEILDDDSFRTLEDDPGGRAARAACRTWSLYHQGRISAALAEAQAATEPRAGRRQPGPHGLDGVIAACWLELDELDEADIHLSMLLAPDAEADTSTAILYDLRSQLRLAQQRPDEALADAMEAGHRTSAASGQSHPGIAPWRSSAALAHLALEDPAHARQLAEEELELARQLGLTRVVMRDLRVLGLVAGGKQRLDLLSEAVAEGESQAPRLEYLEALVASGAATRRANRRTAARERLTVALNLCRDLGSPRLAERASVEIAATGGRLRHPLAVGLEALTPSERRVADLAAQGRTTRQIAAELFVTAKTVEFHLRHVYGKLDIPSTRAELTKALQEAATLGPATE